MDALTRMLLQPQDGLYREFHAVKAYSEPKDLDLYRQLVPAPLDLPDIPAVMVFAADYTRVASPLMAHYREAAICLRTVFKDELGWLVLTMPVTSRFAMWLGRSVGFPKYIPDSFALLGSYQDWSVKVAHHGVERLSFEFSPGAAGPLPAWMQTYLTADTFFHDCLHLPLPDGRVRTGHLVHAVPPRASLTFGRLCVVTGPAEPGAGLIEQGLALPAVFCEFVGGINLDFVPPR